MVDRQIEEVWFGKGGGDGDVTTIVAILHFLENKTRTSENNIEHLIRKP